MNIRQNNRLVVFTGIIAVYCIVRSTYTKFVGKSMIWFRIGTGGGLL